jgi:hypothetical protein
VTAGRELATHDHEQTRRCTDGGVSHDFRPYSYEFYGRPRTSWRCVWCHGVTCGNYGTHDPCWEIYHHRGPHRSRAGIEWPIGGTRPDSPLAEVSR